MTRRPRVGLLGGTFDPIHHGHLAAADAAQHALGLARVLFVPAADPPHRPDRPRASSADRAEMIRLAIDPRPGWELSDIELQRPGPSYTIDTLRALHRTGLSPLQLFFITGADAFAEIRTWHRYPAVLDAAHFVVVTRPGVPLDALLERVPELRPRVITPREVADAPAPRIVLIEAETPAISATEIRARVARGEPIGHLVPRPVAAYIAQKQLYRAEAAASARPVSDASGGE
jgi:nicotinate-nucleotide adenylyltransferase